MRQVTMVTLLVSILALIMQCSTNQSLSVFNGRMEALVAPIDTQFNFAPYTFHLYADTVKWLYDFPSGGGTRASIIFSGQDSTLIGRSFSGQTVVNAGTPVDITQNYLDLAVETHTNSVPGIVHLAFDSAGGFLDTVLIETSTSSGVILPASSRLFVTMVEITPDADTSLHTFDTLQYPLDTIQLADPHAAGGQ